MASSTGKLKPRPSSLRLLLLTPVATTNQDATRASGSNGNNTTTVPSPFPSLLHALTGTEPSSDLSTFAGHTSHPPLELRTRYYSSDVAIWCDEVPFQKSDSSQSEDTEQTSEALISLDTWRTEILSEAAREVRAVIGAIVIVLPFPTSSQSSTTVSSAEIQKYILFIRAVHDLRCLIEDEHPGREIGAVILLQPLQAAGKSVPNTQKLEGLAEKLEDSCMAEDVLGWEFIFWEGSVKDNQVAGENETSSTKQNAFSEKTGFLRFLEVLQGIDWLASVDFDELGESVDDLIDTDIALHSQDLGAGRRKDGVELQSQELQREMLALNLSLNDEEGDSDGEERKVDNFPALLSRVSAIREAGSEMSKSEREAFARREVERLVREMDL